jgi:hypothetical protein
MTTDKTKNHPREVLCGKVRHSVRADDDTAR